MRFGVRFECTHASQGFNTVKPAMPTKSLAWLVTKLKL
jgi:hypothetical protein